MIKVGGLSAEVGDTAVEMDELIGESRKVETNRATSGADLFSRRTLYGGDMAVGR